MHWLCQGMDTGSCWSVSQQENALDAQALLLYCIPSVYKATICYNLLMVILGLTGPISHGKSSFAEYLTKLEPSAVHLEASIVIAEVANAMQKALTDVPDAYNVASLNNWLHCLPSILSETMHVETTFKDIELNQAVIEQHPIEYQKLILHVENLSRNPDLLKNDITYVNKEAYRPLLQWLGGYLVQKIDPGIWYNEIIRRIHKVANAGAELCIVGGLRYPNDAAIMRASGAIIIELHRPGHLHSDSLDPTERERLNIKADCTILNNGTLADLEKFAGVFLEDLHQKQLDKIYRTATL